MTDDVKARIESYLLSAGDWVPVALIVERFQIDERDLRASGRRPGPLSHCAIFSSRGIKHLTHSTLQERIQCRNRIRRELISRARRLKWFEAGIHRCLATPITTPAVEKHTGQTLLFQ